MTNLRTCRLENRTVIAVDGEDRRSFLQGLISNDTTKITEDSAIYAALLTPQGKYLFDFFIIEKGESLYIDCEANRAAELKKKLTMYKLRSKVTLRDLSDEFAVYAVLGEGNIDLEGAIIFQDPRLGAMGRRALVLKTSDASALGTSIDFGDYDALRLSLGLADSTRDLVIDKDILLEIGFDELNGVDWKKGCYMGQELTARTKYRGLVKKRLLPVEVSGPLPEVGTDIISNDKVVGEVRSGLANQALALIRIDSLAENAPLQAGSATLKATIPDWVVLPEAK